ncbi:MAG TPA: tetraacyldisaccharide 4'-kinase [Candidatus Acidoferrum sp.]|jgi:tetraacyldisaccharide 4'-kinase|nr:tetraacyldisaccharide 4'-kinase [Candidatus Acidoferrum sp.]
MNLPPLLRYLLWPLSVLYGGYVLIRAWLYARGWLKQERLRGQVISVGNLTVGGTGKTPMVLWLAEKFLEEGKRVAILSRGYRGSGGTSDEIEMMKHRLQGRVAFGVGKNRYAEGHRIEAQQPIDIFLLDDAFQHLSLARDLDIVMIDGSRKFKDEWLLPSGLLREPISACRRADILVVTRKMERPGIEANDAHNYSIFYAQTRLLGFRRLGNRAGIQSLSEIGHGPFFAFCGIGNPGAFFDDLSRWNVSLAGQEAFRDHHRYTGADLRRLENAAQAAGAIAFVTTEKDAENLAEASSAAIPIFVSVIDFVLTSESEFITALKGKWRSSQVAPA